MDGAFALVLKSKSNKILLVKRRDYPIWIMPGGGVNKNEAPEKAVIREVFEESGFKVKITRKIAEYSLRSNRTSYFFECKVISGKPTPSRESSNVEFFDPSKLPEPINPQIFEYLEDYKLNKSDVIKKANPEISKEFANKFFIMHPLISVRYLLTRIGIRTNI